MDTLALAEDTVRAGQYAQRLNGPGMVQGHVDMVKQHLDALPNPSEALVRATSGGGAELLVLSDAQLFTIKTRLDGEVPTITVENYHLDNGATVSLESRGPVRGSYGVVHETTWVLNFPNGETIQFNGTIIPTNDGAQLRNEEEFARAVAQKVGFRVI